MFDWQVFGRSYNTALRRLPAKADAYTATGRVKKITLNDMEQIFVTGVILNLGSCNDSQVAIDYNVQTPTKGQSNDEFIMALPATPEQIYAAFRARVLAYSNSIWSLGAIDTQIVCEDMAYAVVARSFSNPSLAVNTSRQASATRDAMVNASVDITSTISLTTGQTGKVSLQYADNTGFSTNVVTVQTATNGNTGSLTIGLNLSQVYTAALTGIVPAGKYYRLVTTNVTGTPTYGTPAIQEVLL